MKALVLWADPQQPNLGVQALHHGTVELAKQTWPGIEVRSHGLGAAGGTNDGPMNIAHVPPLLRERVQPRRGLREWLTDFDVVLDTRAGDSFTDIYGLKRLVKMSLLTEYAHHWKVPVVLTPQTIGPFTTRVGRGIARRRLRTSDLVLARDPQSAHAASDLGRPVDLTATDVVFALPRPDTAKSRDVIVNVSGLLWHPNPHVSHEDYRSAVRRSVLGLEASGREVSLLAHVVPTCGSTHDNDIPAVEALEAELPGSREILVPTSLEEVRRQVGSGQLVVGARMHACLNALSMGTPCIPMAYSRKFAPLLADLGWDHVVDLNGGDVARKILDLAAEPLGAHVQESLAAAEDRLQQARSLMRSRVGADRLTA